MSTRILIAEDEPTSRRLLEATLERWGYAPVVTCDGRQALQALTAPTTPVLAILDWMMPGLNGPQVCRQVRALARAVPTYLILLTAKDSKADIVAGLEDGADDFMTKPFDPEELKSRIRVGLRMVELQQKLADRVAELTDALARVRQLHGLLPICAYCKKIRDDQNYWQQVETYVGNHADVRFSHGICPDCFEVEAQKVLAHFAQGQ